ncbi:hypothetical protein HY988_05505 [Candidatus Micrarchaeota archaeon]|nr:hypothetical protein [Candidatus Micrarchaeota archaeon]
MSNLFERSMRARPELLHGGTLERSLSSITRAHHNSESAPSFSSPIAVSHPGSARAIQRLDPYYQVHGKLLILVAKLPILGADEEVFYISDGGTVAHEAGAFMALEARGKHVPDIYLGFTYLYGGEVRFGVVADDLTFGGAYRLERPPITTQIERIHAVIRIPLSIKGSTRTVFCDAKAFEQSNPEHARVGAPFIAPDAIIDLGSLD